MKRVKGEENSEFRMVKGVRDGRRARIVKGERKQFAAGNWELGIGYGGGVRCGKRLVFSNFSGAAGRKTRGFSKSFKNPLAWDP